MKRRNATRSALFTSIISLLLCVSMLVGTTFAWFTDSVVSGNNVIAAGNLDVELYHSNDRVSDVTVTGKTDLFKGVTLWEPGAMAWENFEVVNEGSLALKYQLALNFSEATETAPGSGKTLADVLKVAVVPGGFSGDRADAKNLAYNYDLSTFSLNGSLVAGTNSSDVYGIVVYWKPNSNDVDNQYNVTGGLSINLGVVLSATQMEAETDSFGKEYDAGADDDYFESGNVYGNVNDDGSATFTADVAPALYKDETTIEAPAGTFNLEDKVEVEVETTNTLFEVTAGGATVASLDVKLTVNGVVVHEELQNGKVYTVTTYISKGLDAGSIQVNYAGDDGLDDPTLESYDPVTGELVFTTNHFSKYTVSAKALAYDLQEDTALTTLGQIVEASKEQNNSVIIPEANENAIEEEVNKLPEEEKQAAVAASAVAKIGNNPYATLAAAFAAAQDGDTITLVNNVATSAAITNSKNVTLNLNGKTVSGTDTITGSFAIITNKAALTITGNGRIELVALNNRGWNAYSSVISNTVGGKLVVENGTIEHLGGSDMAYGIDNLTNGKGTYAETIINGGTVRSPYRAIRMFLNGVEADNILTINGGTIEGANKSVWMQDPSANANTGKLTVSKDAVLNGDVYLFVTAGSTEWPVTVSIAEGAVNGEVITGNVPDGYALAIEEGYYVVKDSIPYASVTQLTGDALNITTQDGDKTLNCGYTFLPTQTKEECEESGYAKWHADFVITVDKTRTTKNAGLAGYYSAWCDEINDGNWFALPMVDMELPAGEEFRLIKVLGEELGSTITVNYEDICEYAIREENRINGFLCGAYADESMDGVTMNVQLRLYEVTGSSTNNYECETGNYIVIGNYSYTFGE